MSEPLVSVIISTYNYGRYLTATVESVLAQDFPSEKMEILVWDDGSTDDTPDRMRAFGDRIHYKRQENVGLIPTLNDQLSQARGRYIMPIDADDLWDSNKVSAVFKRFESEPELGAISHSARLIDADGKDLGVTLEMPSQDRLTLENLLDALPRIGHLSCVSFRKAILEKILPIPGGRLFANPDIYLFIHTLFFAPAGYINLPFAQYRQHGDNWSERLGQMKAVPRQLRIAHETQKLLDVQLRRRLKQRKLKLRWDSGARAEHARLRLERLVLLNAYAYRRARARRLLNRLEMLFEGRRRAFKKIALSSAILSPSLYRHAHLWYRNTRAWVLKLLGRRP